jgi:SAM-dependent methyltransferase
MPAASEIVFATLDAPYRLDAGQDDFVFRGWAEVDDEDRPDIRLTVNGVDVPLVASREPHERMKYPDMKACSFKAPVRFSELLAATTPSEPFLLTATLTSDHRRRVFEYGVSAAWLKEVFGRPLRPRPIPPEALQVRVTGAAAGQFHLSGVTAVDQLQAALARAGRPLGDYRRILDFGCGPARLTGVVRDRAPGAALFGCDIDAEAIAWCRSALGDVADFQVNGETPPLPYPDESFDLVYCVSIFTHLPDEMQWPWLAELRRVLRPGGVLLTTKLDPAAYDLPEAVRREGVERGFVYWGEAKETDGLPGFYRLAYHTREFIEREWSAYFEVLHVGSHDLNFTQDSVLLRRPRHGLSWLPSGLRKGLHGVAAALRPRRRGAGA